MIEIQKIDNIKKGDLFGIRVDSINRLSITTNNACKYNYNFCSIPNKYEMIGNQYLLCLYLGNGLAREYYTSIIFNITGIDKTNIFNNSSDYVDFLKKYEKALKHPLSITIDDKTKIYSIDSSYYKMLSKNEKYEKNIKLVLKAKEKFAKEDLINKFNNIKDLDHIEALKENEIYNLKKTLK